jgi:hypothetical protein
MYGKYLKHEKLFSIHFSCIKEHFFISPQCVKIRGRFCRIIYIMLSRI